jgi:hypothetical protein
VTAAADAVSKKNQRHCLIDEKNLKTELRCQLGRPDEGGRYRAGIFREERSGSIGELWLGFASDLFRSGSRFRRGCNPEAAAYGSARGQNPEPENCGTSETVVE